SDRESCRRMRPQCQRCDDAEASTATAAKGPEEIRFARVVAFAHLTVRGHDLRRNKIVAGQTPRTRQNTDATAERQSRDADRGAAAGRDTLAACCDRVVDIDEPRTGADRHLAVLHVDRRHAADVDHKSLTCGPAAVAVPAAAQREPDAIRAREAHAFANVLRGRAARDRLWSYRVETRVVQNARSVVRGIARSHESVAQRRAERVPDGRRDGGY